MTNQLCSGAFNIVKLETCLYLRVFSFFILIFLHKIYYEEDNQLKNSYFEQFLSQYYAMTSKRFYNFHDL